MFLILPELNVGVIFCRRAFHVSPSMLTKCLVSGSLCSSYKNPLSVKCVKLFTRNNRIISGSRSSSVGVCSWYMPTNFSCGKSLKYNINTFSTMFPIRTIARTRNREPQSNCNIIINPRATKKICLEKQWRHFSLYFFFVWVCHYCNCYSYKINVLSILPATERIKI